MLSPVCTGSNPLKNTFEALGKLGRMGSIGFVVGITLVLAFLGGRELDGWLGTGHFFAIALMFVALIGLTVEFWQIVRELNRDRDDESPSSQESDE